jgi:hypothetical protein
MTRPRIIFVIAAAAAALCGAMLVQLIASAIGLAHGQVAGAELARDALERPAPVHSEGSSAVLLALAVAAGLQLTLTWVAKRTFVQRHFPRVIAFLLRPLMISIVSLVVADLVVLAEPLYAGDLTRMEALGAIGGHVLGLMRPTLALLASGQRSAVA